VRACCPICVGPASAASIQPNAGRQQHFGLISNCGTGTCGGPVNWLNGRTSNYLPQADETVEIDHDARTGRAGTVVACLAVVSGIPVDEVAAWIWKNYHRGPSKFLNRSARLPASLLGGKRRDDGSCRTQPRGAIHLQNTWATLQAFSGTPAPPVDTRPAEAHNRGQKRSK
jgi:hypothetical protein